MLSSLPKLGDRAFILGAFLPTLIFVLLLLALFHDQPLAGRWLEGLVTPNLGQAAYMLLAVWTVAVVTLMVNRPLYRFFEGYMLPHWMAERLKRRQQRKLQKDKAEIIQLYNKWAAEGDNFCLKEQNRYQRLRMELIKWMPWEEDDILPTSFGNAIRAFEVYPSDVYGADGVVVWLRLATVMPETFIKQIQDVRSQIDFLINSCLFSMILGLLGLFRTICTGQWYNYDLSTRDGIWALVSSFEKGWLGWAAGGAIAAFLFYRWAVSIVPRWGNLVMSAFDCYLPALASQLGFALPQTEDMRRVFWTTFSQQIIFRREPTGEAPFNPARWKQILPPPTTK